MNTIKKISLICLCTFLFTTNNYAQKWYWSAYCTIADKIYDVHITKPDGFKMVSQMVSDFIINRDEPIGTFYQAALQSEDGECLILYPIVFSHRSGSFSEGRTMTYGEIKAALKKLEKPYDKQAIAANILLEIGGRESLEAYSNADSVFVFRCPLLAEPYQNKYTECIGINVSKIGFATLITKILLTEKGKEKENEYIKTVFNNIKYGDSRFKRFDQIKFRRLKWRYQIRTLWNKNKYGKFFY